MILERGVGFAFSTIILKHNSTKTRAELQTKAQFIFDVS